MLSVDTLIAADNAVRVIDLFVDLLDLKALGFNKTICKQEGRRPFHAKDMLKLYYYGYLIAFVHPASLKQSANVTWKYGGSCIS
jgi:transposase